MAEATDNRKEETSDFPPGFHPGPLNKFYNPIRMIRDLAKKQKSGALAQLASRVASAVRFGGKNQADIFLRQGTCWD